MSHTKEEIKQAQKYLMTIATKHSKIVDGRTLTILQKNKIYESLNPDKTFEEVPPILNNKNHPNRISGPAGPLFFYLTQRTPPKGNIVNLTELFFATNIDIRKASFDYFSNLEDKEIPILTPNSRTILKALGEPLLSTHDKKWREAAVAIYDALNEDWYCNYAAVKQCLHGNYVDGVSEYLTKIIRPTIPSVDSVTPGVWEASEQKENILSVIDKIIDESIDIEAALNKYFLRLGHLPLRGELSIINLIDKWQAKHSTLDDIWKILWAWADSFSIPLPRYHVCAYFISKPDLVPEDNHAKLWHEIVEVIHIPNNEEEDLEWTQAWRIFCEIARHYCCHLEARLPFKNGEIIASQAWWLAVQICNLFTSKKAEVKRLRNQTFLPELTLSSRIWQIASPAMKPSSLRLLTLNTNSMFSISLQAMLGNNLDLLKPSSMTKEDHIKIEHALSGTILNVFPPKVIDDSKKVYSFENSIIDTAKKWLPYVEDDKTKEMINVFVAGIEKLIIPADFENMVMKFTNSHYGDQLLIASYLKNMTYIEEISLDVIWKAINDSNWREAALSKSQPYVLQLIFDALNEIESRYQEKWAYNLPHFYALELEKATEPEKKKHLFGCVIYSSLCGDTVSAIQRLLKGDHKQDYEKEAEYWSQRLKETQKFAPELVKARIRPILAALHI
ncbi:MAG: hypothetical protein JW749_05555 [Sedimentisphaerales bacterium]|nr:hypothetical protein [Sedimentisphaerales bacterium]